MIDSVPIAFIVAGALANLFGLRRHRWFWIALLSVTLAVVMLDKLGVVAAYSFMNHLSWRLGIAESTYLAIFKVTAWGSLVAVAIMSERLIRRSPRSRP
jgi:hypothetical protein